MRHLVNRTLKSEDRPKKKGRLVDWKNLYFPIGCGMMKDGVPADVPLVQQPDGSFVAVRRGIIPNFKFEIIFHIVYSWVFSLPVSIRMLLAQ